MLQVCIVCQKEDTIVQPRFKRLEKADLNLQKGLTDKSDTIKIANSLKNDVDFDSNEYIMTLEMDDDDEEEFRDALETIEEVKQPRLQRRLPMTTDMNAHSQHLADKLTSGRSR